jgi:hypothetical protein
MWVKKSEGLAGSFEDFFAYSLPPLTLPVGCSAFAHTLR